ncbi:MAG: asparagine synthase (glutamine-hydrolyzing), partial [Dehalococcoidia bacterium]
VFLMNRRLAILDLSEAGWQPMTAVEGRYFLVFNGEIYNFIELRGELEALGHTFRSGSDTEVLLAAYIEWGPRALTRLVGMFAFAILDTCKRSLFLARDFSGIKPLYYATPGNAFAFASEIKALLDLPGISRRVDPQRLYHYLRFSIVDHRDGTLFADVRQLPAAHYMEVPLDNPSAARPVRYWRLAREQRRDLSFKQAATRFRDLFLESIRLHLRSDVPVGVALSGGIDSSAVIMAMRQLQGPNLELHSFSYIAEDQSDVNEECWVDLVAGAARSTVHKVRATPQDLLAELDDLIETQEEPFANTAIFAQYRVFRLAHEAGIKVMLSGQGADEILGGYRPYLAARLASYVRHGQW